jgi:pimeloyl-ACP methyl ester carboxylesterase
MKNIVNNLAGILLLIVSTMALSACTGFKHSVYETALNCEYGKVDLSVKYVTLNGKSIALLESPVDLSKPNIVLIHGFGANKENWVRFAAHLTENYHVLAIDLPGHGQSIQDLNLQYDMDDQVGYVHEILQKLKIQKFHMAGNSMGGAISALYAATYPEKVISLWLFNPGGIYTYESEFTRLLKENKNPLIVDNEADFDKLMDFAMEKKLIFTFPKINILWSDLYF